MITETLELDDTFYVCCECSDYIECELACQNGWSVADGCEPMCPDCEYKAARV